MIIMDAANSITQEKELLEKLLDQSVEGIILQPSSRQSANYTFISERNIPLLLVDRQTDPVQWTSVLTNNRAATREVLEKALAKGYEQVVVISEPIKDVSTRQLRYETVDPVVKEAGKQCQLIEISQEEQISDRLSTILEEDLQTLLFASNGRMLMDVLTWLIHQEIAIPEKVGVTGFDDWNLTELVGPGITSVEQPSKKIGEVVAKQLLQKMTTKSEEVQEIIVPSTVRWRKSV
jgi:LacI family kdg operon repressor